MTNRKFMLGLLGMVLLFALAFTGCPIEGDPILPSNVDDEILGAWIGGDYNEQEDTGLLVVLFISPNNGESGFAYGKFSLGDIFSEDFDPDTIDGEVFENITIKSSGSKLTVGNLFSCSFELGEESGFTVMTLSNISKSAYSFLDGMSFVWVDVDTEV